MRYLPVIPLLWSPFLLANTTLTPWQSQAIQERQDSIRAIRTICREVDEILLHLEVNDTPDDAALENSSMPVGNPGETVAESDGGMLFDAANSRVTYINNVRVNDERARLRCARRLYVQLPQSSLTERQDEAKNAKKHNAASSSQSASGGTSGPTESARVNDEETPAEIPGIPMADAPATLEMPVNEAPLDVTTDEAVIDTKKNCILLTGNSRKSPGLHIRRGANELALHPTQNGAAPTIMADANGDIMINSGRLRLVWQDKEGTPCELQSEAETIYYRAAEHSLLIQGKANIRSAHGTLRFDKGATIVLEPDTTPHKDNTGFMSQFTNVRIAGIAYAEAWGNVVSTHPADAEHLAGEVHGEHLVYNAKAGTCLAEGKNCRLVYGNNTMQTDGSLRLEANGDIILRGSEITGTYERPAPQDKMPPIHGTFRTAESLIFSADQGTITAAHGISLKDDYSDFSCSGPLVLSLSTGKSPRKAPAFGNLNLAIAQYSDISHARASGNIVLHHGDTPAAPDTALYASEADLNLLSGEATLTAASGQQAILRSKGYEIAVESAQTPSLVELAANGDIHITGEQINTTLPTKEGASHIHARQSLHLARESGQLLLGPNSRLTSPDGILTANGPLTVILRQGAVAKARPILPRYPHLVYNYDGLTRASTRQGGTIQTEQASMQCRGAIEVVMNPQPADDSPTSSISQASAEDNVALAGKDSTGRIISATGDRVTLNGATGEKRLTGSKVTLADAYNIHTAYGPGASVVLDNKNNARITGSRHSTSATRIHDQIEQQKSN